MRSNLEGITGENVSIFEGLNSIPKFYLFSFSIRQTQPSKFTNCRQTTVQILCRDLRGNNEPMKFTIQLSENRHLIHKPIRKTETVVERCGNALAGVVNRNEPVFDDERVFHRAIIER